MARLIIDTKDIPKYLWAILRILVLPVSIIVAAGIVGPRQIESWNAHLILEYVRVLAWPLTAIIVLAILRSEIPGLARRMKRAAIGSASVEFNELQDEATRTGALPSHDSAVPGKGVENELELTEQFRVDNLIASLYYAGLSNIALLAQLPASIGDVRDSESNLVDQSFADYHTLRNWIDSASDSKLKISKSPVKHLYEQITAVEDSIRLIKDFYRDLDSRK